VQGEVPSECEAEGLLTQALRIRINLQQKSNAFLHNPSVTASPCQLPLHKGALPATQSLDRIWSYAFILSHKIMNFSMGNWRLFRFILRFLLHILTEDRKILQESPFSWQADP